MLVYMLVYASIYASIYGGIHGTTSDIKHILAALYMVLLMQAPYSQIKFQVCYRQRSIWFSSRNKQTKVNEMELLGPTLIKNDNIQ